MIQDALNAFFTRASVVGPAGTPIVSDIIDTGPLFGAFRNLGRGEVLRLRAQVETSVTSGGSSTLTLSYADSPNADGSGATVRSTYANATVNPASGTILWDVFLPDNLQRYVELQITPQTAATTAGVVSAAIVKDSDSSTGQYGWSAQVIGF